MYGLTRLSKKQIKCNNNEKFLKIKAIDKDKCNRCGSLVTQEECNNCSEFGVIKKGDYLYYLDTNKNPFKYNGNIKGMNLTNLQKKASDCIIKNIKTHENTLIWAVCGAGKTEITFKAIEHILLSGGLVCFAIPRIDILYEIKERLEHFFPDVKIAILNSKEPQIQSGSIFVMTTNQLLKFYDAFDLIIVDEVDAFPFEYHPKFKFAVQKAKSKSGVVVYLTSTPSEELVQSKIKTFTIYKRWHDFLLPVPKVKYLNVNNLIRGRFNIIIFIHLKTRKRQQLWFVANVKMCVKLKEYLKKNYKGTNCDSVHSKDENRLEKIEKFREGKIDILITTPILERGVTFRDIDVLVLDSNNELYNIAALVQIAGRANRNIEFQGGRVFFYHNGVTRIMKTALKQIKSMNNKNLKEMKSR